VGIFILTAALLYITALPLYDRAVVRAAAAPACPANGGPAVAAAAVARAASPVAPHIADRIGARGEFIGRRLAVASTRGALVQLDLPAESSVAPAVGKAIAYTAAAKGRSEVHVIDVETGCDFVVARPTGIARSALLSSDGDSVYVHSVTAARADAGVTRYDVDGSDEPAVVVPPLPADERFGRTFGTQLALSSDGGTLAVQSCALHACRTRLLDVASGHVETFDDDGQGAFIGVDRQRLVTYSDCTGLPCPVIAISRATGASEVLAEEAWSASIAASSDGRTVVSIETAAGISAVAP
jgi:dipeptidyl aminopeptidase/acylaminoacyl peptidase